MNYDPLTDTNITGLTIISIFVATCSIYKQSYFIIALIFGFCWNQFCNSVLKLWIKEPRPSNMYHNSPTEKYGMPSGHAQQAIFLVTFIYLMNKSPWLILFLFLSAIIVIFQRYHNKAHTIKQLVVGTILGAFNACLVFYGTKYYIQSL